MINEGEGFLSIISDNSMRACLATAQGTQPYVRHVTVIRGEDFILWVATARSSRKVRQIQENPSVALSFADPGGRRTATVLGRAEVVDDPGARLLVWQWSPVDLSRLFPAGPEAEPFCALRIVPDLIEWREGPELPLRSYSPA